MWCLTSVFGFLQVPRCGTRDDRHSDSLLSSGKNDVDIIWNFYTQVNIATDTLSHKAAAWHDLAGDHAVYTRTICAGKR